ncbi:MULTISPECIES: hypothetical protein [unclassified Endozoicomonas]|uniref:hypothetical protein n=1 Tax=unclassified Endozoicomonas TaxID=2644528 RepID=UPI002148FC53|nr:MULTISPECIES: hypothetical protein [unclassified Endozoicomonas]
MLRGSGYGKAIAEFYEIPSNSVQKQLVRLKEDGVLVSHLIGKVREYQLNSRYPFLSPLQELLKSALPAYPDSMIQNLTITRSRPRASGKPTVAIPPGDH